MLITGGTGGLGALVARHLVTAHGVRDLLLAVAARAGGAGRGELRRASWPGWAPRSTVVACDVADRDAVGRPGRRRSAGR